MDEDKSQTTDSTQVPVATGDSKLDSAQHKALEALAPLISKLDVEPNRKFEICMNAIRLTDNKELVDTALEAALAIPEPGTKAEALVELVNEINYLKQA